MLNSYTAKGKLNKEKKINFKRLSQNLLLIFVPVLITASLIEFVVFPACLKNIGFHYSRHLPRPLRILAHPTYSDRLPKNYIAIYGDSYAEGAGDWIYNSQTPYEPWSFGPLSPFKKSTNYLLYEKLNQDILSFGEGGNGSLATLISRPNSIKKLLNKSLIYPIEEPSAIVAYIYEGNDFLDNLTDFKLLTSPSFKVEDYAIPKESYENTLVSTYLNNSKIAKQADEFSFFDNLFFWRGVFLNMLAEKFKLKKDNAIYWDYSNDKKKNKFIPIDTSSLKYSGTSLANKEPSDFHNLIQINNQLSFLPLNLQGPPMHFSKETLSLTIHTTKLSLKHLKNKHPDIPIYVVYIPSPISCYHFVSSHVRFEIQHVEKAVSYKWEDVLGVSEKLNATISKFCNELDIQFVNLLPALREASKTSYLHGPDDFHHFNYKGSQVLANTIVSAIQNNSKQFPKAPLTPPSEEIILQFKKWTKEIIPHEEFIKIDPFILAEKVREYGNSLKEDGKTQETKEVYKLALAMCGQDNMCLEKTENSLKAV